MTIETPTKKKTGLKPIEVGAGAGAAVITAFASSYLGTAGTLTGAAVASVIGTVSTSVLRSSADRSAERLRQSTLRLRQAQAAGLAPTGSTVADPDQPAPTADPADRVAGAGGTGDTAGPGGIAGPADRGAGSGSRGPRRPGWLALAAGAVVAFAAALVLITGIESAAGKPLAGLVGNETGGGTTIQRATGGGPSTGERRREPATTPTPTSTSTPSGGSTGTPTGEPSATDPTAGPSATEPAPEPSATTPAPTTPAPTPAPTPSADPLTSPGP